MASQTRRIVAAGAVAAAALALTACGNDTGTGSSGDGNEEVSLYFTFWGDDSRADRYEQAIDLFEAEHPNITVQTQYSAMADYWTARSTEGAAQSLPDVIQMDLTYLEDYVSRNWLIPLDDYTADTIDITTLADGLLPAAQIDGTTYGIPTGRSTLAVFVDNTVVDGLGVQIPEPGYTWDEYDAFLAEIAAAGGSADPAVYGSTNYTGVLTTFQMWLQQQDKTLITEDRQLGFTAEDLNAWWGRSTPNYASGAFIPPGEAEQLQGDAISVGAVGADISWSNFLTRFTEGSGGDEYTMLPVPSNTDQGGMFFKPGLLLSIATNSEHPDEAAQFIDFLTNSPEVGAIFGFSRGVPASSEALEGVEQSDLDAETVAYEESIAPLLTGQFMLPVAGLGSLESEFARLSGEIAFETLTVEEATDQFIAIAEDTLAG